MSHFRFLVSALLSIVLSNVVKGQYQTSPEYPSIEIEFGDTSELNDGLISLSLVAYQQVSPSHMLLLGTKGEPLVHIWAESQIDERLAYQPLGMAWWESQQRWSMNFNGDAPVYFSSDLELFTAYELSEVFDGHALELTPDGKVISLINQWENTLDVNNYVQDDSIPVQWVNWHIEDSTGSVEIIDLSSLYESLDLSSFGYTTAIWGVDTVIDPIHGNSLDYVQNDNQTYIGTTNRNISEALIMREESGVREFFHFGGPLNQFTANNDSAFSFYAHDFNFYSVSDTTVTFSFFSNGDGQSLGGEYAAGKLVELNLNTYQARLLNQSILYETESIAMGSYDHATNTFAPGVLPVSQGFGFERWLCVDKGFDGEDQLTISRAFGTQGFTYRVDRYGEEALQSLNRPALNVACNYQTQQIEISVLKQGQKDEYLFWLNDNPYTGVFENDSTIHVPINFNGKVSAMTRLNYQPLDFQVDLYTDVITIEEDQCMLVSNGSSNLIERAPLVNLIDYRLVALSNEYTWLYDLSGKRLALIDKSGLDVSNYPKGIYLVKSENSAAQKIVFM